MDRMMSVARIGLVIHKLFGFAMWLRAAVVCFRFFAS